MWTIVKYLLTIAFLCTCRKTLFTSPPSLKLFLLSLVSLGDEAPHPLCSFRLPFYVPVIACLADLWNYIYYLSLPCTESLLREQEESLTQCCNPHLVLTKYLAFRNSNNINSSSNNDAKLNFIYVELNSILMQNFRDLGHV